MSRSSVNIPVVKGKLAPYHIGLSERQRHEILKKKIRRYGALRVFRMLNAQVIFRKHRNARERRIFEEDRDWVRDNYLRKGRSRRRRR